MSRVEESVRTNLVSNNIVSILRKPSSFQQRDLHNSSKKVSFDIPDQLPLKKQNSKNRNKDAKSTKDKSMSFHPYTLKIQDSTMRTKFLNYQRAEIQQRLKHLLILDFSLCILACIWYASMHLQDVDKANVYFFMSHCFTTSACLSLCFVASMQNLKYIEFSGTAVAGSGFIVMVISNFSGVAQMNDQINNQEIVFALLYYFLYVGLLTFQFYSHFFIRTFWYITSTIMIDFIRYQAGKSNIASTIVIVTMLVVTIEIIFFTQMKVQVKLFLSSQMIQVQESQLLNMLDSVPDKVLVCSFDRDEDLKPRPLYNNLQMRQFFGCSLVVNNKAPRQSSSGRQNKVRRQTTFEKRIFTFKDGSGMSEDFTG